MFDCNESALSLPISSCDDCSAYEARIKNLEGLVETMSKTISTLQTELAGLQTSYGTLSASVSELSNDINTVSSQKQDKLTAGSGITLSGNTVSVNDDVVAVWSAMHSVPISITSETGDVVTANVLEKLV